MMMRSRKEDGRVCTVLKHVIRKSPMPSVNRLTAVLNQTKPKSVLGFKYHLFEESAIALPLAPPPLPTGVTILLFKRPVYKYIWIIYLGRVGAAPTCPPAYRELSNMMSQPTRV